jgi:hypothetical protein
MASRAYEKAECWPRSEVPKQWGAPPGGAVGLLGGRGVVYMKDIFILNEIWAQDKIYSYMLVDTLLGWNMKLVLFCNLSFTQVFISLEK